eukprot:552517-Hanusia_phi.AAC.1
MKEGKEMTWISGSYCAQFRDGRSIMVSLLPFSSSPTPASPPLLLYLPYIFADTGLRDDYAGTVHVARLSAGDSGSEPFTRELPPHRLPRSPLPIPPPLLPSPLLSSRPPSSPPIPPPLLPSPIADAAAA